MFSFPSFWQLVFKKIFFLSQGILFNKVYRFHGKVNMGKVAARDKTSVCKRESFLLQNLKPVKPVITTQSGPLDLSCKGCYVMCSSQLWIPWNKCLSPALCPTSSSSSNTVDKWHHQRTHWSGNTGWSTLMRPWPMSPLSLTLTQALTVLALTSSGLVHKWSQMLVLGVPESSSSSPS